MRTPHPALRVCAFCAFCPALSSRCILHILRTSFTVLYILPCAQCPMCSCTAQLSQRAVPDVPVRAHPQSVRVQVNLARLLNGLGDTSLLRHDSALGITVHRSEQYDSLTMALHQERKANWLKFCSGMGS